MIIDEGELRVLLGANGAGKTTLMDLISGKTQSTDGRVFLVRHRDHQHGSSTKSRAPASAANFRSQACSSDLTVRRNLEVASCTRSARAGQSGFGFSHDAQPRVDEVLELIGLTEEAKRPPPISATAKPSGSSSAC